MTYDTALFDMDGVLVERTPSWVFDDAATAALQAFGLEDPSDEEHRTIRSSRQVRSETGHALAERADADLEELWGKREELVAANQQTAIDRHEKNLYQDARALADTDLNFGIVSNNQHEMVEHVLEQFGLDGFDTYYGRQPTFEGLDRCKPDTTYLEQALEDLNAEKAVYVGDRESDVNVAHAAGIDSAFVRRSFNKERTLSTEPTYDVDSLFELRGELDLE
ncbi:HAD family hydrolase [Halolamina sp.]|jgi:HAD superfamily hydrolase (TIGR01549 family)|uniref:HAD family hydrolase n=1 Tax=Halolamina sp. TaxID=1940283 RepID=UPI000223BD2E|nr:HAD-superfamily hydrolase, subfamily IA, variant 1 [halophilic archaeon DL31]